MESGGTVFPISIKENTMKRYLFAAGAGSLVFAAALGSASALSIDAGVAQSGTESLRGDSNGVVVESYGYESDNNSSYSIRVGDVDPSLSGETLWAMVYSEGGSLLGKGKTTIDGTGKASVRWAKPVPVEDIDRVRLTVE